MSDRSAALLAETMLTGTSTDSGCLRALGEQLGRDPPLVLWTCVQAGREGRQFGALAKVAEWLATRAPSVFRWENTDASRSRWSSLAEAELVGDQVAADLALADIAAQLAAGDGKEAASGAYLAGLVSCRTAWWTLARETPDAAGFPELLECADYSSRHYAVRAADILAGRLPAPSDQLDPEPSRQRAHDASRLWMETVPGAGRLLPVLSAKLSRLASLEAEFQGTLEAEKLEAMAEFAAGAGHEINNPLAIIAGRAQLFLRDETDPERRRELATINAQVKRAHEMIADMMLFARPPRPELRPCDLVQLADNLVSELTTAAAERTIALRRSGDPGPLEIQADAVQLSVALHAMCRNSMEAIGYDGQIEIHVRRLPSGAEVRIEDDGPGIPPEHRRHLFDPFYSSRHAGRGLGLGLSKCWRIVTNHGGRIEVETPPGRGTAFIITLPAGKG